MWQTREFQDQSWEKEAGLWHLVLLLWISHTAEHGAQELARQRPVQTQWAGRMSMWRQEQREIRWPGLLHLSNVTRTWSVSYSTEWPCTLTEC